MNVKFLLTMGTLLACLLQIRNVKIVIKNGDKIITTTNFTSIYPRVYKKLLFYNNSNIQLVGLLAGSQVGLREPVNVHLYLSL